MSSNTTKLSRGKLFTLFDSTIQMRIYPKKLRNIEDLEREKKLLRKESRNMDIEDLLSFEGVLGTKKGSKGEDEGSALDFLPISNPLVKVLVNFVQQKLAKKYNKSKPEHAPQPEEKKKRKHPLKAAAFEFIGGYLKWKAIELSYKGIRHLIKKREEKKDAQL